MHYNVTRYRCESLTLNGSRYCEWGYNGLGIDYQVLAGPAFMAVFTVVGVILGVVADKLVHIILPHCTSKGRYLFETMYMSQPTSLISLSINSLTLLLNSAVQPAA